MAKKIMKRSLALGALMAFVITGSAMAADDIHRIVNSEVSITDFNETVNSPASVERSIALDVKSNGIANITGDVDVNVKNANSTGGMVRAIRSINGQINALDKNSSINIYAEGCNPTHDYEMIGIQSYKAGSKINIDVDTLSVISKNTAPNTTDGGAYGIVVMNGTTAATDNFAEININANSITITADTNTKGTSAGLVAMSQGRMKVNGDLVVNADKALIARGNSVVRINEDGKHTTKFNGDVVFEYDGSASGTTVDADVNINFSGTESEFNGKIFVKAVPEMTIPDDKKDVTGMKIKFNNGATWNLTGASKANDVSFGAGSNLKIKGADFVEANNVYALNGNGNDSLKVEKGANLIIEGMEKNTYNIAQGFGNNEGTNFTVVNDNALMQAEMVLNDANELKAVVTAKSASEIANSGISSEASSGAIAQIAGELASANGNLGSVPAENQAAAAFIKEVMSGAASGTKTAQNMKDAMDSALNIGENVGANANAAAVVNNVTGITTQRMSFTQMNTAPQGGHGKVERKYKTGEGVWAQYMHGKDKVEDMPMSDTTTSYDSQYNGIVFGYDFKEVGKTHTGIAFNYGSGDSNGSTSSTHSRSEFDFWGVGLYHSIMNDDTNLIFDINYNKSDTDVTQTGLGGTLTANPKTETMSFGVKAEKLIQNGPVQIVPYAGARFLTIDTDDYHVAGLNATYAPERQNVWLIPVGVSLRQENNYENGWKVTPKADLSYIWALGDTDSSMSVAVGNATPFTNKYTVMDNGSFLGTLGIEAAKGDWTYGLSYSYQKGEYQRSDKWFVDVRYSF